MYNSRFVQSLENRRLLAAYYVSATGDDRADGLTPQTAWRTIDRANARDFEPGDSLLFEGGKTFAAQGTTGANVLVNGGFESSFDAWTDTMGTDAGNSAISSATHTGEGALVINGAGAGTRAQDVTASVEANQAYKVAMWTRVENPGAGTRRIGITFSLGGQPVATFHRGFRNTAWAETDWAFVAPPSFDKATVWVTRTGDTSAVYADDLSLQSLPNGIVLDAADSGTTVKPLIIGSYGTGKATIVAGDGIGLWGGNVAGVRVMNLIFRGTWDATTGTGGNVGVGIDYVNTANDNSKLEFVTVEKCDVAGFQWAGIRVGGWAGKSGFRLALITDSVARYNGDVGIVARGEFDKNSAGYANEKVYVARSKAFHNTGIPNKGSNSGSGILLSDTFMGTVERCIAHNNGALNNADGGPVGIWAFDAAKITLQYSESYANKTGSTRDGAGFDLDSGVTSSVVQHNYSHDNDGAGYLLGQFTGARPWGKNVVRNNISQNDGRKNSYGGITLSGPPGPYNLVIEHNTVYMSPSGKGGTQSALRMKYAGTGVSIRNNIFYTTGTVAAVDADKNAATAQLNANVYWNPSGAFKVKWNGSNYASLAAWRSATTRETISGVTPTGLHADPQLAAPGTAGTLNNTYKLNTLTQYALLPTSPAVNQAVTVKSYKGYTAHNVDFMGRDVTKSPRDVGAVEFA